MQRKRGQVLTIPIAHSDGNYNCDEATLRDLEKKSPDIVPLHDAGRWGADNAGNPNGLGRQRRRHLQSGAANVAGLMPHPERAVEAATGFRRWLGDFSVDGRSAGWGLQRRPA